jgi:predicted amidophosphoribosyltransferase
MAGDPASERQKKCPACAELIKAEAQVCPHCGQGFPQYGFIRSERSPLVPVLVTIFAVLFALSTYGISLVAIPLAWLWWRQQATASRRP